MRARFFLLMGTLTLSACASGSGTYSRPSVITPQVLDCGPMGLVNIRVWSPAEAQLNFRGKKYDLKRDVNSKGAYYKGNGVEYSNRGTYAIIRHNKNNVHCDFRPRDLEPEPQIPPPPEAFPAHAVPRLDVTPYL